MDETNEKIMDINVEKDYIQINGHTIHFPAAYADIEKSFGEARIVRKSEEKIIYIYDALGIKFETTPPIYLRKRKAYVDREHNIVYVNIYVEGDFFHDQNLPQHIYKGSLTFYGMSSEDLFRFFDNTKPFNKDKGESDFKAIVWEKHGEHVEDENGNLRKSVSLSFDPVRPKQEENYNLEPCSEELLEFDTLNFKLAVIQELMYEQEVLKPYFDLYDYLDYKKSRAKTETEKPIRLALQFFKDISIPKRLAENISTIVMDGGNEIYSNIAPLWDGEDDLFSLNEISEKELSQFTNLKSMTIMTSNYEEMKAVLEKHGIQVKEI